MVVPLVFLIENKRSLNFLCVGVDFNFKKYYPIFLSI